MIKYADHPPEFPSPFKDTVSTEEIQAIVNELQTVEITGKGDIPIGATNYCFLINLKDGSVEDVVFCGNDVLSAGGGLYGIDRLTGLPELYTALAGRTRLLPAIADTTEKMDSCLFEMDGWQYYFEPGNNGADGILVRENGSGKVVTVYRHADAVHPAIFPGQSRIVLVQDQNPDSRVDDFLLISIEPDGSGMKTLKSIKGIAGTPMWDGSYLYYVGWSKDLKYPRPLYRVDEGLNKNDMAIDLPGPLLTVKDGTAFCLSADLKSVVSLPSGKTVCAFTTPVEDIEHVMGKWVLHLSGGATWYWTVESGAVEAPKH